MAYETGTATNERDLLQKLNIFLTTNPELAATGENWKQVYTKIDPGTATTVESVSYVWTAPGSTTEDEIFIGCKSYGNITNDIYNLYFAGGTFFNAQATIPDVFSGLVNSSEQTGICADSRTVKYWIFASGRRLVLITSISGSIYSSLYCGFMLPNTTPLEYPYPLVIAGSVTGFIRYSNTSVSNTSIIDPRDKNFWLLRPDLGWYDYYGRSMKDSNGSGNARYITPLSIERTNSYGFLTLTSMAGSPGDHYPLIPIEMYSIETSGTNFWGTLDGVYWMPGMSRASEDIIETADNRRFIVFQNAFRTTTVDFFAVELA